MQLHQAGVALWAAVTLVGLGCNRAREPSAGQPAPTTPSALDAARPEISRPDIRDALCHGRSGCVVIRSRPVGVSNSYTVVDLRLAHTADAAADEDRCDRREYWLVRPEGPVLLAADCEAQWGADDPGPATTSIEGDHLDINYVEFQSSDGCEMVDARIRLLPLRVERQERRQGTTRRDACRASKPVPSPPGGDGSADHPLLVLHR